VTKNYESTSELIEDRGKLMALIDRAQDGDEEALPVLRKVLDEAPEVARIVDLARNVERSIIEKMSGSDVFTQEAIPRNLKAMRKEIAGENPSPLERLLAERVALCWLAATFADVKYARKLKAGMSFRESEYYSKRWNR